MSFTLYDGLFGWYLDLLCGCLVMICWVAIGFIVSCCLGFGFVGDCYYVGLWVLDCFALIVV